MKKKISVFLTVCLISGLLTGCNVSFSEGFELSGGTTKKTDALNGAVKSETGSKIEMQDITIELPEGMKYGVEKIDTGNAYYVWNTDADYIYPTDLDVIMYIYEGKDIASPDAELTANEARTSITVSYMEAWKSSVNGRYMSRDAMTVLNGNWYAMQMTGYSGDYINTTYGVSCYPKTYYGIYALQNAKDAGENSRRYYGFVISNDSTGSIMEEETYNDLLGQIKSGLTLDEFYTVYKPEMYGYNEETDYSKGYSYGQFKTLFENTGNYYIMSAEQKTEN